MPSCEVLSCPVCSVSSLNVKYFLSVGKLERCVKTKNPPKPFETHQAIFIWRVTPIWSWLPFGHFWHPWARGQLAARRPWGEGDSGTPGISRAKIHDFMWQWHHNGQCVCVCVLELCVIVSFVHKINTPTPTIEIEMHKYTQSIYVNIRRYIFTFKSFIIYYIAWDWLWWQSPSELADSVFRVSFNSNYNPNYATHNTNDSLPLQLYCYICFNHNFVLISNVYTFSKNLEGWNSPLHWTSCATSKWLPKLLLRAWDGVALGTRRGQE